MEWKDLVYYDETSPTCLRWKVKAGSSATIGSIAGNTSKAAKYMQVMYKGKSVLVHWIVWELHNGTGHKDLGFQIDHMDCNKRNNKISNLRLASQSNNAHNTRTPRSNTSGYKGVVWYPRYGNWRAYIGINGTSKTLGYFNTKEEAAEARKKAAVVLHKEFARS